MSSKPAEPVKPDYKAEELAALKGSPRPRLESFPVYASSLGGDAIELASVFGIKLDEWQAYILQQAMGCKKDGKWAARKICLIVPRQNGKNVILEARILAEIFLVGQKRIRYTAHQTSTALDTLNKFAERIKSSPYFDEIKGCEDPDQPNSKISGVKTGNGNYSIHFQNRAVVTFSTRTGKAARGGQSDLTIFDEALYLTAEQVDAVLPTMSAQTMDGNPQAWYLSSAGLWTSATLASIRRAGIEKAPGLGFAEYSAPEDCDIYDPANWALANPALNIHIAADYVAYDELPPGAMTEEGFKRERLGIWETSQASRGAFNKRQWNECLDPLSKLREDAPLSFAVDISPLRDQSAISVAGWNQDERVHVELIEARPGVDWLVPRLGELVGASPGSVVVVDEKAGAGALRDQLTRAGLPMIYLKYADYTRACALFLDAINNHTLAHIGQEELTEAAMNAKRKNVGDTAFKWAAKDLEEPLSPLVSCTLAHYQALIQPKRLADTASPSIIIY